MQICAQDVSVTADGFDAAGDDLVGHTARVRLRRNRRDPTTSDSSFHQRDRHPGSDEQVVLSAAVMGEGHRHSGGVSLGEPYEQLAGGLESGVADAVGDTRLKMRPGTVPSFC